MRALIINNYLPNSPQIEELYKVISEVTIGTVEIKDFSTLGGVDDFKWADVVVLSGSQHLLAEPGIFESYTHEVEYIRQTQKPLLGICFGLQLICMAFGESVLPLGKNLKGYYMVHRKTDDELFEGLGEKFLVMQSHEEYVENMPYDFMLLGDSPSCPIEIIKHMTYPIYAVQCHPERYDDKHPAGIVLLENFFKVAGWYIR
jgi:GMP synthase-like glutamine amidotransferase